MGIPVIWPTMTVRRPWVVASVFWYNRPSITKEVGVAQRSAVSLLLAATALPILLLMGSPAWSDDGTERIVLVRHGEKPDRGLGQLDCQGLNRALKLPSVIAKTFGRPAAIFAPDPSQQKADEGVPYDYVRPLATEEPSAIFFGLPINADFGAFDSDRLRAALAQPIYRNALVLVGWEHTQIENIARALLADNGGDASVVPKWHWDDFDSIYVVAISRIGDATKATFAVEHEGLNGQPTTCPQ